MTDELRAFVSEQSQEIDDTVREAVESCGGSPMRALYTTIIANKFLSEDNARLRDENVALQKQSSAGFGRRRSARS